MENNLGCTKCKGKQAGRTKFTWMYIMSLYVFVTSIYGNIKLINEIIIPWFRSLF